MVGVILDGRLGYIYGVLVSFILCGQDINNMWLIDFSFSFSDNERRSQFQVMTFHRPSLLYRF